MLYRTKANAFVYSLLTALRQEKIYLLPLRLFIGIGWLRAGLEKWLDPGWHDGSSLRHFLEAQVAGGHSVFHFYTQLVQTVFEPASLPLGLTIMVCQFLVGMALITGTLTNLALLGGLFMNLNFILAGAVTPSTFYVIIQLVLLLSNIGAILGLDYLLAKKIRFCFLVAKANRTYSRLEKRVMGGTALLSLVAALGVSSSIKTFGSASVEDPAMILFILSLFTAAFFLVTLVQAHLSSNLGSSPNSNLSSAQQAVGTFTENAPALERSQPQL